MSHASITRRVFVVFFLVLFACGVSFGVAEGRQRLVSAELLSRGGLEIVWDDELPIDRAEKLQKLYIVGDKLYALSERNYLISLGKDRGEKIFARYAAPPGQPISEPVLYEDKLISVLGNRVVTMDERTGDELGSKNIEYRLMCPVVRNSKYFYLSGADKRLHVLRAEGMVPLFEVSVGNSIIKSVIAGENFVIFGTDAGNVISMLAGDKVGLWQFDASGGIIDRLVPDETSIFFSTKDMNVYRIDMTGPQSVKLGWKYKVAGLPENAPRVGKDAVYQYVRGKGLTAIDKVSGEALWSLREGVELLSESGSKAYIITKNETLTVMDNSRVGGKLYSMNFRGVRRFAFNSGDSRMYIADERGRVACLQPVK